MEDAQTTKHAGDMNLDSDAVILFDGICNLCNGSVNFIIDRDKHNRFKFAALQSDAAVRHLNKEPGGELDSIVLIENGTVYKRSTAALRIARRLNGFWPILYIFILVPPFIRDAFYNWIALNRYSFFGTSETCRVPTPELRDRFID